MPEVTVEAKSGAESGRRTIRAPRDFAAGSALVGVALFTFWAGKNLDTGTLHSIGPGMVPRAVAVLVGAFGIGILLAGLLHDGPGLERWRWRGPFFVCVAVLAFGGTIRTVGLALAGPLVIIIGGYASPEARWKELVAFAVAVTIACILLFRYVLGLSIPILTIPGVITL